MFHVQMFRQRMYNPFYTYRQLANALRITKEDVAETYGKSPKLHLSQERIDRKKGKMVLEDLIDVRGLCDEDKFNLVRGYTILLEENYGPMLLSSMDEIVNTPEVLDTFDSEVLRIAMYRSAQFDYVYAACAALNLSHVFAAGAVSLGFDMPVGTLADIEKDHRVLNHLRKRREKDSFVLLSMNENLRYLALCCIVEGIPMQDRLPELDFKNEAEEREFSEFAALMKGGK